MECKQAGADASELFIMFMNEHIEVLQHGEQLAQKLTVRTCVTPDAGTAKSTAAAIDKLAGTGVCVVLLNAIQNLSSLLCQGANQWYRPQYIQCSINNPSADRHMNII